MGWYLRHPCPYSGIPPSVCHFAASRGRPCDLLWRGLFFSVCAPIYSHPPAYLICSHLQSSQRFTFLLGSEVFEICPPIVHTRLLPIPTRKPLFPSQETGGWGTKKAWEVALLPHASVSLRCISSFRIIPLFSTPGILFLPSIWGKKTGEHLGALGCMRQEWLCPVCMIA